MEKKVKNVETWKLTDKDIDRKKADMQKVVKEFNTKVQDLLNLDCVLDVACKEKKDRQYWRSLLRKVDDMSEKFDDPVIADLAAKYLVNADLTKISFRGCIPFLEGIISTFDGNPWKELFVFDKADNVVQPSEYHQAMSKLCSDWSAEMETKIAQAAESITEKSQIPSGIVEGMTMFLLDNVPKSSSFKVKEFIGFAIAKPAFYCTWVGKLVFI